MLLVGYEARAVWADLRRKFRTMYAFSARRIVTGTAVTETRGPSSGASS
ncbi:hypothetical protein [Streptomyces sp. NPDC001492]